MIPGAVPGPITRQLQVAFSELVGVDFVAQYLAHLGGPPATNRTTPPIGAIR